MVEDIGPARRTRNATINHDAHQPSLPALRHADFEHVPATLRASAFGVEYVRICECDGAMLFVTRDGWPMVEHLLPERWYQGRRFATQGYKLPDATGSVYRLLSRIPRLRPADLLIKFSRVAQEVPLVVASTFKGQMDIADVADARFNSPFEEFGLLDELRRSRRGPRLHVMRPLAIYTPGAEFELWRLGRTEGRFGFHEVRLEVDQEQSHGPAAVELNVHREYVVLYQWLKGENAQACLERGLITDAEFHQLVPRVTRELEQHGYRVLDNKAKHYILRVGNNGQVLRRDGRLIYGLVDFELLVRIRRGDRPQA